MSISINWNSNMPFVDANIAWFQQRIQAGSNDGSLVSGEQQTLNTQLNQIQQLEQQDQQSGLSQQESQQLWGDLSQMNSDIYSLTHNSLGTNEPASQNGQPPDLITSNNFWNNPAVQQEPWYSSFGQSNQNYSSVYANDYSSALANDLAQVNKEYPAFNFSGSPQNASFTSLYGTSNSTGFNQLIQFENQQTHQTQQSVNLFKQYQPSFLSSFLPGAIGLLPVFL